MHESIGSSLVQVMAWHWTGAKVNQWSLIVYWTPRNITLSTRIWINTRWMVLIREHVFENVVCKMSSILFRPPWVNQDLSHVKFYHEHLQFFSLTRTNKHIGCQTWEAKWPILMLPGHCIYEAIHYIIYILVCSNSIYGKGTSFQCISKHIQVISLWHKLIEISMAWCKRDVTPVR